MRFNLTELPEWQALEAEHALIAPQSMKDWFAADPHRFQRFSLQVGDLFLDYSKNRLTKGTLARLIDLAKACDLPNKINSLLDGGAVNGSEQRAALHTALRANSNDSLFINDENIHNLILENQDNMRRFTEQVRAGQWLGATGKPIRDIVNIGIGGSHLGPLLTTTALADFAHPDIRCHFISNIDAAHIQEVLAQVQAETTLFILSSKSFTTLETACNAVALQAWLKAALPGKNTQAHWVAVTAATDKALEFGIPLSQIFPLWDWVGGRYSIWSAIGLPLALLIGMDHFTAFLNGAKAMDHHFRTAPFEQNMPVLLALIGVWYINFFGANNQAIIPYSHRLTYLQRYLQQADMESNGKYVTQQGDYINYATGPIIWGEQGCNGQHAFHQLLHQGQHFIPVDFILVGQGALRWQQHQDILVASGLSQAQALLYGKSYEQAYAELVAAGINAHEASILAKHKTIAGNRPSNVLFISTLNPYNLGALLSLYEHKIYVQGAIWNINSFDQWGVELGKQLLPNILSDLQNPNASLQHDSSTQGLISHYEKIRALS